jgi:hypothetical protein
VHVLAADQLLKGQQAVPLVHPLVARALGQALLRPARRGRRAGAEDAAAVRLRRLVRALAQPFQMRAHLRQGRADGSRHLQLAGADLALRLVAQQRQRLGDDVRRVGQRHRLGVDEVVLLLDPQGGSDLDHRKIMPGGQREAARLYCRTASGTNTARMSADQITV